MPNGDGNALPPLLVETLEVFLWKQERLPQVFLGNTPLVTGGFRNTRTGTKPPVFSGTPIKRERRERGVTAVSGGPAHFDILLRLAHSLHPQKQQ